MLIWIISFLGLAFFSYFWFNRQILPTIIKNKAHNSLYKTIFPNGDLQKHEVIKIFHEFTNGRFTDDEVMDYFMKIKGIQDLSMKTGTNFWVRKYLLSPTKIKLNYFEQVKFYELFINFPSPKIPEPIIGDNENDPNLSDNKINLKQTTSPATKKKELV